MVTVASDLSMIFDAMVIPDGLAPLPSGTHLRSTVDIPTRVKWQNPLIQLTVWPWLSEHVRSETYKRGVYKCSLNFVRSSSCFKFIVISDDDQGQLFSVCSGQIQSSE